MDNSDIEYVLDLLKNGINDKDWDSIYEAQETLQEFLEDDEPIE